jgi:predicted membrane protein
MQDHFGDETHANGVTGRRYSASSGIFACPGRGRALGTRLVFAVFLIAAGTLLFLDNLGLIPVHNLWAYWPLVLVALGTAKLSSSSRSMGRLWGSMLVVGGALILACNLGLLHVRDEIIWPLLLIAVGLVMLMQTLETRKASKYVVEGPGGSVPVSDNLLHDSAIFGSVKRKFETQNFQGGEALSVFGNVEVDVRRVQIPPGQNSVSLEANALFGAVKLRIPETWRVEIRGAAILGNYEDKTTPPRIGVETPTLIVTGYAIFGSVEIVD